MPAATHFLRPAQIRRKSRIKQAYDNPQRRQAKAPGGTRRQEVLTLGDRPIGGDPDQTIGTCQDRAATCGRSAAPDPTRHLNGRRAACCGTASRLSILAARGCAPLPPHPPEARCPKATPQPCSELYQSQRLTHTKRQEVWRARCRMATCGARPKGAGQGEARGHGRTKPPAPKGLKTCHQVTWLSAVANHRQMRMALT